jgi:predicted dehydrogenase
MGLHHVRAAVDMADAKLIAVVDVDRARADETAQAFQCRAFYSASDLVGLVDAVTIATPPGFHAAAAVPLLRAGISCLIEKPLALNEADCLSIIQAAKTTNAIIAVGQVERFNPATESLLAANITPSDIRKIDVRRLSPAGGRQVAVDVVSDMMIHDIEIVLDLKRTAVSTVRAEGDIADWATAELTFADGTSAHLTAHRKAETRVRELELQTAACSYHLDFMARTVTRTTNGISEALAVHEHDALRAEIGDFLDAVRAKSKPRVDADEALNAMRVAWQILKAIGGPQS